MCKGTPRLDIVGCRVPLFGHFWLWCSLVVLFPLLDIVGCGVPLLTGWLAVVNLASAGLLLRHLHKVKIYMKCFNKLKKGEPCSFRGRIDNLAGSLHHPQMWRGSWTRWKPGCINVLSFSSFFPPFRLHFFFLQIFSHIEDLCLVNERVQASSKDLNQINANVNQFCSTFVFCQYLNQINVNWHNTVNQFFNQLCVSSQYSERAGFYNEPLPSDKSTIRLDF